MASFIIHQCFTAYLIAAGIQTCIAETVNMNPLNN